MLLIVYVLRRYFLTLPRPDEALEAWGRMNIFARFSSRACHPAARCKIIFIFRLEVRPGIMLTSNLPDLHVVSTNDLFQFYLLW